MMLYTTLGMASLSLAGSVTLSPCYKDGNEAGDKVTQKFFWVSGNRTAFQSPSTLRSFAPITLFSCSHRTTSHLKLNKCMKIARIESGKRMEKLKEKIKNTALGELNRTNTTNRGKAWRVIAFHFSKELRSVRIVFEQRKMEYYEDW